MIKIISGKYKGKNLASLSTKAVRPTQARIKKSLLERPRYLGSKN